MKARDTNDPPRMSIPASQGQAMRWPASPSLDCDPVAGSLASVLSQYPIIKFSNATKDKAATEASYASFGTPALEISLILEGSLTFFVDGQRRSIEGPCVTFQAYRKSLDVLAPARRQVRTIWCNLAADELTDAQWRSFDQLPTKQPISGILRSLFFNALLLSGSTGYREELPLNDQVCNALGAAIFLEYARNATLASTIYLPSIVVRAKRALDANPMRDWSVEELARAVGASRNYLVHLFKKHIGEPPIRYLWNRRVDAGVHLLRTTSLSIEEISHCSGFQSSAHFSRRIKQRVCLSPGILRQAYGGAVSIPLPSTASRLSAAGGIPRETSGRHQDEEEVQPRSATSGQLVRARQKR